MRLALRRTDRPAPEAFRQASLLAEPPLLLRLSWLFDPRGRRSRGSRVVPLRGRTWLYSTWGASRTSSAPRPDGPVLPNRGGGAHLLRRTDRPLHGGPGGRLFRSGVRRSTARSSSRVVWPRDPS